MQVWARSAPPACVPWACWSSWGSDWRCTRTSPWPPPRSDITCHVSRVTCHEYQRDHYTQPLVLAWCAVNRVTLETGRTNHPELCLSPYTAMRGGRAVAVLSYHHPACSLCSLITVFRCDALSSRDPGCPGQARLPRGGQGGKPRRVGGEPLESGQNEDQRHQNIVQGVSRRQMLILRHKINIVKKTSTKLLAFHAHQFQVMTTGRKRSAIVLLLLG